MVVHTEAASLLTMGMIILLFAGAGIADASAPDENTTIRIAIFQMSPDMGNFSANHATIETAIVLAAKNGADWFITPEMAESGYEFIDTIRPEELPEFPSPWFRRLGQISRNEQITLFIGFPERNNDHYHNSVAVIGRDGNIAGIYQKNEIIPGKYEEWASPGNATPLSVDGHTVGYYICADVADEDITHTYIADNVEIIISSAVWFPDPSIGPETYWKNVSEAYDVPFVVANTAGKIESAGLRRTESGVYQHGRVVYRVPDPDQVVAFIDWNYEIGKIRPALDPIPVE